MKYPKIECQFCSKQIASTVIKRHEDTCYLNPKNIKNCEVCGKIIINYKENATCSYACSNKKFRSGPDNANWSEDSYRSTCFHHHKKECIICGENNIVQVHHLDENNQNNKPENLIPLCPTHHQYWHSRYKNLIEQQVYDYIKNWSGPRESNPQLQASKAHLLPQYFARL